MSNLTLIEKNKNFNGFQYVYSHYSKSNKCEMRFSIYLPNTNKKLPVLYFLSGLTCTEQNFIQKSGMQKYASKEEMIIVGPDTSPRGNQVPDLKESFLGKGAGFYLNATQLKWKRNYNMYDYITKELPKIVNKNFNVNLKNQGIMGHSMGGMGSLVCGVLNKKIFKSISAFAPICDPSKSAFSYNAFTKYLGKKNNKWNLYNPIELFKKNKISNKILIDQGLSDEFIKDLYLDDFIKVCKKNNQKILLRKHKDHGHGYYFISTFIKDHIKFHKKLLS